MEQGDGDVVSVLVVDDQAVFTEGLTTAFAELGGLDVVGVAVTGTDAVRMARSLQPQVVLASPTVPELELAELVQHLCEVLDQGVVVVLAPLADDREAAVAVQAGAVGYLTRDQGIASIAAGVQTAARGETVLPPVVAPLVRARIRAEERTQAHGLTARELEVLSHVAAGLTNQAIADAMFISLHTVRNHVANILGKLGVHSKLEAAALAIREHLVAGPPAGLGRG